MKQKNNRSVRIAALVALCFFMPVLLAYLVFSYHSKLHLAHTNKGTLMTPIVPAAHLNVAFSKAQNYNWSDGKKHWTLMYLNSHCGDTAKVATNLNELSHMHAAMGKNDFRLRMVLVLPNSCHVDKFAIHYKKSDPDFKFGALPADRLVQLQSKLSHKDGYYIIDPMQNIMMYYASGFSVVVYLSRYRSFITGVASWISIRIH